MGGLLSALSENHSSPQCSGSITNSNIQGDNSGNKDSNNTMTTNNTYYNHGCMNTSVGYREIMQCLYTSKYEEHRRRVREPVEGTCAWITDHPKYRDWFEKKTSGLLWLSADPGCGKSVAASFLITHLKTQTNAVVCYFFFKDDSDEQRSPKSALCALLHQLFTQKESLYRYAEKAFNTKGKGFAEEVDTLWDILVKVVTEGGCGDVICVVDALDECEEKALISLTRHITNLSGSKAFNIPLKFLVTSRPYHRIEIELSSRETTIRLKGEDEIKAITTDVTRVIDEGVRSLELVWGNPGGLEYLRELLRSKADRTFLWVSLILELLRNTVDGSRVELINIVSTAPASLDDLYTRILSKSTDYDRTRRVLHMVVSAAEPLTLDEMNIALTIRRNHKSMRDLQGDLYPSFERTVKNLCGLFVRVINSKIYLVHQTAREFLIKGSSAGQGSWQYTLCPKDSNLIMAEICISYLSLEEFENDPLAMGFFLATDQRELDDYLRKYGFLNFAARHWAGHFRDSQDRQVELFESTRSICEARSKRFQTWLQVYWPEARPSYPCPKDWTHLMIASQLGQGTVVERLLEEGGDINARSEIYGTALNIAAIRRDKDITRMLLRKNVKAYLYEKEYSILHMKKSELEELRWFFEGWEGAIEFLQDFCIPDTPDPPGDTASSPSVNIATD